jgi:enoyl-CoA hydratase/carnithine racemase
MYEQILYEVSDPIATITLNRPKKLNAWTPQMGDEVKHALAQAEADTRVVVIILTGAGRGFCSGADLSTLSDIASGENVALGGDAALEADPGDASMGPSFRGTYSYFPSIRKPIIAAINGPCAGMAVPISLFCDLRFASDRATFLTAFVRRGLIAEWGVSWILPKLVGPARALDLLLSSRTLAAPEAFEMGLVNKVVPHDELLDTTRAYALELATHCCPTAMSIIKRELYQHMTETHAHAENEAVQLMLESFQRPDFQEGVAAVLEKRTPKFARLGAPTKTQGSR